MKTALSALALLVSVNVLAADAATNPAPANCVALDAVIPITGKDVDLNEGHLTAGIFNHGTLTGAEAKNLNQDVEVVRQLEDSLAVGELQVNGKASATSGSTRHMNTPKDSPWAEIHIDITPTPSAERDYAAEINSGSIKLSAPQLADVRRQFRMKPSNFGKPDPKVCGAALRMDVTRDNLGHGTLILYLDSKMTVRLQALNESRDKAQRNDQMAELVSPVDSSRSAL